VSQGISADLAVLDPPRTGAGKDVMAQLARLAPRRVVYVACDPSALARDVKAAAEHGYGLASVEAWDAFPMTHHVECIAVLERGQTTPHARDRMGG
ncbi:MAG: class I SAM-dependent RNA methyltransferase, partial [Dermatophilaceae bacterium]|nr:class I SAM-dependent RNA methyltransferase [Dermatophilaceae bacterium]